MVGNDSLIPIADGGICQIKTFNKVTVFDLLDKQYRDSLHHLSFDLMLAFLMWR